MPSKAAVYCNREAVAGSKMGLGLTSCFQATCCGCCLVAKPCLTLFANPLDCNPPGSSVVGFPGKNSGVDCHSPGDLPDPGIKPTPPALADGFFTTEPPGKPLLSFLKERGWSLGWSLTPVHYSPEVLPFGCFEEKQLLPSAS